MGLTREGSKAGPSGQPWGQGPGATTHPEQPQGKDREADAWSTRVRHPGMGPTGHEHRGGLHGPWLHLTPIEGWCYEGAGMEAEVRRASPEVKLKCDHSPATAFCTPRP